MADGSQRIQFINLRSFGNHWINNYGNRVMTDDSKTNHLCVFECEAVSEPSHKQARVVDRPKKDVCCLFKQNISVLQLQCLMKKNHISAVFWINKLC